jgi:hypothetical protein
VQLASKTFVKNVVSHLSQIETLVIITKSVNVWFLFNLNLTLLVKSNTLAMKNLITHCVTHGLSHCLDISSSILKMSDQNMVFSFAYLEKKKPKDKFVLSPTTKVVGYSSLEKNTTRKNA